MARLTLRAPQPLTRFIATKGSVALDGVSLTVNEVERRHLLGADHPAHACGDDARRVRKRATTLNLEVDLMARYAARLMEHDAERGLAARRCSRLLLTACASWRVMTGWPRPRHESSRRRQAAKPATGRAHPRGRGALLRRYRRRAARRARPRRSTRPGAALRHRHCAGLARNRRRRSPSRSTPPRKQKKPYDGVVALGCVIRARRSISTSWRAIRARADGFLGRAQAAARQRHPHRRHRGAGLGARAADRERQGRRRRARGARADRAQAPARARDRRMAKAAPPNDGRKANRRGAARLAAVQALYQMDIAGDRPERDPRRVREPLDRPRGRGRAIPAGRGRVLPRRRAAAWSREQRKLDPLIDAALAQGLAAEADRDACCARSCAPAPTSSTASRDVPARVVVSEYVDVANAFVERDETGMVNAVLDQLARQLRAGEFEAAR